MANPFNFPTYPNYYTNPTNPNVPPSNKPISIETNLFISQLPQELLSSQPLNEKEIVVLKTKDGEVLVRIRELANFISFSENELIEKYKNESERPFLGIQIQLKVLGDSHPAVQNYHFIKDIFEENLSENASEKILNKIVEIYNKVLDGSLPANPSITQPSKALHIRRDAEYNFPIELNEQGQKFGLLHDKLGEGSLKRVKFAINLQTLELTAHAVTKLPLDPLDYETAYLIEKALENEIKMHRLLAGKPEFVQLIHVCTYIAKDNSKKIGLMLEFCNQGDLYEYNKDQKYASQMDLWKILGGCLGGLVEMARLGIRHRDLKPENIFVNDGCAKIGDFGHAILIDDEKISSSACGTLATNSPEYAAGHTEVFAGRKLISQGENILKQGYANIDLAHQREKQHKDNYIALTQRIENQTPEILNYFEYTYQVEKQILIQENLELLRLAANQIMVGNTTIEQGRAMVQNGLNKAANLKGDVWAMGMILFEMRNSGRPFPHLPTTNDPVEFLGQLANISQSVIDSEFPPPGQDQLADLNALMLRVNPDERPSAEQCLEIFSRLPKTPINFLT